MSDCIKTAESISRTCELGTEGCEVRHTKGSYWQDWQDAIVERDAARDERDAMHADLMEARKALIREATERDAARAELEARPVGVAVPEEVRSAAKAVAILRVGARNANDTACADWILSLAAAAPQPDAELQRLLDDYRHEGNPNVHNAQTRLIEALARRAGAR